MKKVKKYIEIRYVNNYMYNTRLVCTYKIHENDDMYRKDLLDAFHLDSFDEAAINKAIEDLFHKLSLHDRLRECMRKSAAAFLSEDLQIGFMGLFTFDFFDISHPCICEFLETGTICEQNIKAIESCFGCRSQSSEESEFCEEQETRSDG